MRSMCDLTPRVGSGDSALDKRLSDELDKYNAAATAEVAPAEELTVRIEDAGELVAGASGWTWGEAAGIGMTWGHEDYRQKGLGSALLGAFEDEARRRGCSTCSSHRSPSRLRSSINAAATRRRFA